EGRVLPRAAQPSIRIGRAAPAWQACKPSAFADDFHPARGREEPGDTEMRGMAHTRRPGGQPRLCMASYIKGGTICTDGIPRRGRHARTLNWLSLADTR